MDKVEEDGSRLSFTQSLWLAIPRFKPLIRMGHGQWGGPRTTSGAASKGQLSQIQNPIRSAVAEKDRLWKEARQVFEALAFLSVLSVR